MFYLGGTESDVLFFHLSVGLGLGAEGKGEGEVKEYYPLEFPSFENEMILLLILSLIHMLMFKIKTLDIFMQGIKNSF